MSFVWGALVLFAFLCGLYFGRCFFEGVIKGIVGGFPFGAFGV